MSERDAAVEADDKLDIEIVDDTPEGDRGRPKRPEGEKPYDVKDEEISQYSESVQSRIKRLRYEYHEERRAKEQAERERSEAVRVAQTALAEKQKLQELALRNEKLAVEAAKQRAEADLERAKRMAREAYESGDTQKAVDFQADIAKYAMQHERFSNYVAPEPEPRIGHNGGPSMDQPRQEAPKAPKPDQRALNWAQRNEWFGQDEEMTGTAYGVHERLVKQGVDPRSDDYYRRLDDAMRRRYPERFDDEADTFETDKEAAPPRKTTPVVAPATRSVKTPRKVQLTATQVALANKLGLPLEVYAAELLKANHNG